MNPVRVCLPPVDLELPVLAGHPYGHPLVLPDGDDLDPPLAIGIYLLNNTEPADRPLMILVHPHVLVLSLIATGCDLQVVYMREPVSASGGNHVALPGSAATSTNR